MCGIAGYFGSDSIDPGKMVESLRHRGPDNQGSYTGDKVGLGSRRLSIVGSSTGDQPVHNEDESLWAVFNGEIYNHEDLRRKLETRGHSFYTETDTEVLVHAYEEWGHECFKFFEGMYAVAIWNVEDKRLILARDPIGKKPLYYRYNEGKLLFGSEIKAILAADSFKPDLNYDAARHFLAYGYSKGSNTLFRTIKKLRPGEILVADNQGTTRSFIETDFSPENMPGTVEKAADRLRTILTEDIRKWTREGGPYSVFLSGGIDSSAILAMLSDVEEVDSLKAYTAAFPGSKYNEAESARQFADNLGVETQIVDIPQNAVNMIPQLVEQFDDLMADQACVPYYLLSEQASRNSSVAFTGSGGDELFGGYEHYRIMDLGSRYGKAMPQSFRKLIPFAVSQVPQSLLQRYFVYVRELGPKGFERFSDYLNSLDDLPRAYEAVNAMMNSEEVESLFTVSEDSNKTITSFGNTKVDKYVESSDLRQIMTYEQFHQLPNKNLMKADKTSMAHGLEIRTPLLSKRTLRFSAGLSHNYFRGNSSKKVFKRAMKPYLPENVINRKKQRLLMPIHEWMKNEALWTVEELSDRYGIPPVLDESQIARMIDGLNSSPLYYSRQLWNVAHFIVWYNRYLEE